MVRGEDAWKRHVLMDKIEDKVYWGLQIWIQGRLRKILPK